MTLYERIFGDHDEDDEEIEEEFERMCEAASQLVLPMACAVIIIIFTIRNNNSKKGQ